MRENGRILLGVPICILLRLGWLSTSMTPVRPLVEQAQGAFVTLWTMYMLSIAAYFPGVYPKEVAIRVHHVRMGQRDLKAEIFVRCQLLGIESALLTWMRADLGHFCGGQCCAAL
ncbi:unnamed protein product, partial [Mycena citricolor]